MRTLMYGAALILFITAAAVAAPVPACEANQLSLAVDAENGNFNGMSHSGTLLVLRNIGPSACAVPGFPLLTFRDAAKQPLAIHRQVPRGMHPGPVVVPAIIAPGAEVTASLRWVSGDVYDHGTCLAPATLSITVGDTEMSTPIGSTICGDSLISVTYTATRLNPDPVYTPKPDAPKSVHP